MSVELDAIRKQLDAVDRRIVESLAERQRLVDSAAEIKASHDDQVRDDERERRLLRQVRQQAADSGVDPNLIAALYRRILSHSVRRQTCRLAGAARKNKSLRVSFQGTDGAYSQIAARHHFASFSGDIDWSGLDTFREILDAVSEERADYAILPIENTTAGSINEAYDLLAATGLAAVGEEILPVEHCLVALDAYPVERIRRILSHPQALAQCSAFLASLANCRAESYTDTAMAVEKILADGDSSQAAIASQEAADHYGLSVIRRHIANQAENHTRFLIIGREPIAVDDRIPCKTSLVFATRHQHGALASCLQVLAEHSLSLTKLESRPKPRAPWEYLFYADFEGNVARPEVRVALRELAAHTHHLKVLGCYPSMATRSAATPAPPAKPARPVVERGGSVVPLARAVGRPW